MPDTSKPEYKSCQTCKHCIISGRYGCAWRSEVSMFTDKSPCLNWENTDVNSSNNQQ